MNLQERKRVNLNGSQVGNYIPDPDEGARMVTGVNQQEKETTDEVTFQSPVPSSGKQKKIRSTSQPQFISENTPGTLCNTQQDL